MQVHEVFPIDQWPVDSVVVTGVTRRARFTYEVPPHEATVALVFSDASDTANSSTGIGQVVIELAPVDTLILDMALVEVILGARLPQLKVTASQSLEEVLNERAGSENAMAAVHSVFCHPKVSYAFEKHLPGAYLATHEGFPAPTGDTDFTFIFCMGAPGLVAKGSGGSGAFIFTNRFFQVHMANHQQSRWDRLLQDNNLIEDD